MERLLNKVDKSLRDEVVEVISSGKTHAVKQYDKFREESKDHKSDSSGLKEKYLVQVSRTEVVIVEATKEDEIKSLGRFLDMKE